MMADVSLKKNTFVLSQFGSEIQNLNFLWGLYNVTWRICIKKFIKIEPVESATK